MSNKRRSVSRSASLSAVIAALYAISVVSLAPVSFQPIQLRLADAMLPLTILFGWPAVVGVTVGCLVANLFGGLGAVDVVGGSAANFVAGLLAWRIGLKRFKGAWLASVVAEVLVIALIVGSYLSVIFSIPLAVGVGSILASNIVTIGFMGYALLRMVQRALRLVR
ncbi:MAG: QueT transporter family protein [Candidatus Bathyarchaeia archaeon]